MTDTANAPERIKAWMQPYFSEIGSWSTTRYPEVTIEYVLSTHCDELVAAERAKLAAVVAAQESVIKAWPRVRLILQEYDNAFPYAELEGDDESVCALERAIRALAPDNSRAPLTARDERMKAEAAREAHAKIARLTEALKDAVEIVHKSYVLATMEAVNAGPASPIAASHDAWRAKCVRAEEAARAALQENANG